MIGSGGFWRNLYYCNCHLVVCRRWFYLTAHLLANFGEFYKQITCDHLTSSRNKGETIVLSQCVSLECAFSLCNQCMLYRESKKIRSLTIDLAPSNFHLCKHCFRIRWLWPTLKSHSSLPLSSSKSASTTKKRVSAPWSFCSLATLCLAASQSALQSINGIIIIINAWQQCTVHCSGVPIPISSTSKKSSLCETLSSQVTLSATQPPLQSINWCSAKEASSSMATVASPTSSSSTTKKGFSCETFANSLSFPVCHSVASPEYNVILFTLTSCTSTL